MVENVGDFVCLNGEELAPYEQDVGQTFGLVNVAQGLLRFCRSFISFNIRQFIVHQARGNDGEGFLASSLVRLLDLVACRGQWRQLRILHDIPKIFGGQHHLQLELVEVEVITAELIERDVSIGLTRSHFVTKVQALTHSMYTKVKI